jgi:hypothetical protein
VKTTLLLPLCTLLTACTLPPSVPTSGRLTVSGTSMGRTTPTAYVLVVGTPFRDLRTLDTVLYYDPFRRILVHHRILSRDRLGNWSVKGDANQRADFVRVTPWTYRGRTAPLFPESKPTTKHIP